MCFVITFTYMAYIKQFFSNFLESFNYSASLQVVSPDIRAKTKRNLRLKIIRIIYSTIQMLCDTQRNKECKETHINSEIGTGESNGCVVTRTALSRFVG